MINTSNEYKKYIADSVNSTLSRDFRAKADIELADGTVLTITEEDIVVGGLKINDATSISNSFQIGAAIINQCTLMLNNIGGKFDQYDFTDAVIRPYIGLKLSETTEWLKKGIFTVDEPTVASSIISLVALDNMNKFDTPFSDVEISFPCTQLQLLQAVCLHCGVSLTNATFTNSDFTITRRPNDEAITCREIVAWIAQISGNFARCNINGALELKWYDMEVFEETSTLDGGCFDKTQISYTETKSGKSIQQTDISKNSTIEIQKIEGATTVTPTNPLLDISPDNVATITSAKDFDVVACGKNLIDYTKVVARNGTTLSILADGEISAIGKKGYTGFIFPLPATLKGKTISALYTILEDTTILKSIRITGKKEDDSSYYLPISSGGKVTIPTDAKTIFFEFMINNSSTSLETDVILRVKDIQIEEGSTATPYEPYKSNKINISRELNKIPNTNIADSRERIDDKYVKYTQRIGKVVLDGSVSRTYEYNPLAISKEVRPYISNYKPWGFIVSDKFKAVPAGKTWDDDTLYIMASAGAQFKEIAFRIPVNMTAVQFFTKNPTTVLYELAEPIEEIVEEPSQLTSYQGTTNVFTTANPLVNFTAGFNDMLKWSEKYESGDNADGGNFSNYNSGDNIDGGSFLQMERYHHIYALNQATIGTNDVIITGIQVKAQGTESDYGETVLFGNKGYVIEITNPLITENTASIIANSVGAKIVGMMFRPCNISVLSDPSREAGDVAYLSYKDNVYQILLTSVSCQIGGEDRISCDAETPSRKQSVRFDANTKAIIEARKEIEKKLTAYDLAVKQLNSVMTNAMGYYPTSETQEDGSTIDYMHDKPTLAESTIIWKKSIDGFAVSTDGGTTYTSGFTADGNIIAKTLSVIGINAEWIKVLTSFTVGDNFSVDALGHLISKSGEIGPFKLDERGFFSKMISIYEDANYPLIWMTQPDEDMTEESDGDYAFGGEGSARANYEPSVCMVRKVENGIETNVGLFARETNVGAGAISIDKYEGSSMGGNLISEQFIADGNITYNEYDSNGNQTKSYEINPQGIIYSDNSTGKMVGFFIDTDTGELFMQADRIELSGDVYINGVKQ